VAEQSQWLQPWPSIKENFEFLAPLLQFADVVVMAWFVGDEVVFEILLLTRSQPSDINKNNGNINALLA
jgi:hypothetical protein